MAYDFNGKKILVTGAGRNVGRAIATSLAKQDATIYALDCVKENLDDLVKEIPDIIPVHQDLEDWDETSKAVDKLGNMDGLVNCAAVLFKPARAVDVPRENLKKCQDVNLNAPINLMQVIGKKMVAAGRGGSIVNISSIGSVGPRPGSLPYSVSKAGLNMATKMFALELGPHNIRVNCIHPGPVLTDMYLALMTSEEQLDWTKAVTPLGRLTETREVANLVSFLLSDQSAMISGATHVIDGGLTNQLPHCTKNF